VIRAAPVRARRANTTAQRGMAALREASHCEASDEASSPCPKPIVPVEQTLFQEITLATQGCALIYKGKIGFCSVVPDKSN
jgi:hypothetical protein